MAPLLHRAAITSDSVQIQQRFNVKTVYHSKTQSMKRYRNELKGKAIYTSALTIGTARQESWGRRTGDGSPVQWATGRKGQLSEGSLVVVTIQPLSSLVHIIHVLSTGKHKSRATGNSQGGNSWESTVLQITSRNSREC